MVTPFIAEDARRTAYQTCHRKELRESSRQYPNPIFKSCVLCGISQFCLQAYVAIAQQLTIPVLAFDQIGSLCIKEGCADNFCASCTLAQRTGHRHHLYEVMVRRSVKNYTNQITCNYCLQGNLTPPTPSSPSKIQPLTFCSIHVRYGPRTFLRRLQKSFHVPQLHRQRS
jgi:hypothetical protein